MYETGLIVGKFAPLHKGHLKLIEEARRRCSRLVVLSYMEPEFLGCEAARREEWLAACAPYAERWIVTARDVVSWLGPEARLPANDAADEEHREFVFRLCRHFDTRVDAVFTSEAYGDGFAAHLSRRFLESYGDDRAVRHVSVDPARSSVPISSTVLRQELWRYWEYLPAEVAVSLSERVVFLGGESSGKSTLAEAMAKAFETEFVHEYGRELYLERHGNLVLEDMVPIAREQIRREQAALMRARRYVFCDTSPLTTLFYSVDSYGRAEPELLHAANRRYHRTYLCAPDFPFVQDGSRRDHDFRQMQHEWYLKELAARDMPYRVIGGSLEERVKAVRDELLRAPMSQTNHD
jgi:NadR type nicotinamide-nucleotide adenylyltransferase